MNGRMPKTSTPLIFARARKSTLICYSHHFPSAKQHMLKHHAPPNPAFQRTASGGR
jgi:hypothetical protein